MSLKSHLNHFWGCWRGWTEQLWKWRAVTHGDVLLGMAYRFNVCQSQLAAAKAMGICDQQDRCRSFPFKLRSWRFQGGLRRQP